jgi:hypothetical protein
MENNFNHSNLKELYNKGKQLQYKHPINQIT